MEDSQCIERNCSAFQVKTLKGRSNGLPASVAAESLTNVSLEQAFQKGLQLRGEDVWKFHILGVGGRGENTISKMHPGKQCPHPRPDLKAISCVRIVFKKKKSRFIAN